MTDYELLALMSAIIYAGIMANPDDDTYLTPKETVERAQEILQLVKTKTDEVYSCIPSPR